MPMNGFGNQSFDDPFGVPESTRTHGLRRIQCLGYVKSFTL